ncbi:unnamed protein product, partial [Mesorhabditis spiculigera]
MGERKGQNHYYPPDFNYKKHKSLNHYHGTHALRERAAKLGEGIMIIRFEMPYNIWCLGCNNHVGMGVRYNAEKKKIGKYYTTTLYEFRMKCHLCDNWYTIHTDPKNLDYVCVEGCRRQQKQWDPEENGQFPGYERTKAGSAMSQKLAADAMFKREHGEKDKAKADTTEKDLNGLEWLQERMRDDYSANSHLRARFRAEKKELNEIRARDDALRARGCLTIPLAPEREDDKRIAGQIIQQARLKTHETTKEEAREAIESRRIYGNKPSTSGASTSTPKSASDMLKESVQLAKTKWINEKFADGRPAGKAPNILGIVRRKRVKEEVDDDDVQIVEPKAEVKDEASEEPVEKFMKPDVTDEDVKSEPGCSRSTPASASGLVDYGSASDSGSD